MGRISFEAWRRFWRGDRGGRSADCPSLQENAAAREGLLPLPEMVRVLRHAQTCEGCRREIDILRGLHGYGSLSASDIEVFLTHLERQLLTHAEHGSHDQPETQTPRQTTTGRYTYGDADRVETVRAAVNATPQVVGSPHRLSLPKFAGIAALLTFFVVMLLKSPPPPLVFADFEELLHRAAEAERAQTDDVVQRVRMQLTPIGLEKPIDFVPFDIVREVSKRDASADDAASHALPSRMPPTLARAQEAYRLDLDAPLSVASFVAWRATLTRPNDRVTFTRDGYVRLLTTAFDQADDGEVRAAELTLRTDDLRVVRHAIVLASRQRFDAVELTYMKRRALPAMPKDARRSPSPSRDTLDLAELDARLLLREANWDVGGAIRITRSATQISVEGVLPVLASSTSSSSSSSSSLSPVAMSGRFEAIPFVHVDLQPPTTVSVAPSDSHPASKSALSRWAGTTLAGLPERDKFAPRLRQLAVLIPQRLANLHRLGKRYPIAAMPQLSPAARVKLDLLVNQHHAALLADLIDLRARLWALAGGSSRSLPRLNVPDDWRRRAAAAMPHARELRRLIDALDTQDDLPTGSNRRLAHSPLSETFGSLWEAVNATAASSASRSTR